MNLIKKSTVVKYNRTYNNKRVFFYKIKTFGKIVKKKYNN